jgi:uncharacterized protein (DUF488 family)
MNFYPFSVPLFAIWVKFGIRELHIMMCGFCENHRGESCTYMYVIWKVEYALVWSIPFATLLYLFKTSKNSQLVHPNEVRLFQWLDSPRCPHILKSCEGGLHFRE